MHQNHDKVKKSGIFGLFVGTKIKIVYRRIFLYILEKLPQIYTIIIHLKC